MNKIFTMPKNTKIDYINDIDGIIVGLKDYAIGINLLLTIEEIEQLKEDYNDKELFVVINKNLENKDINYIEKILCKLDDININGVFFYDLAILLIKNKYNLNIDLVWNQSHMVTNYNTCNYYYDEGVKYALLSSEITVDEMNEIKNNSKIIPFIYIFGKNIIAHSKRCLVSNYFNHFAINKDKDNYEIEEKVSNKQYEIIEGDLGTTVRCKDLLNGINAIYDLKDIGDNYFIVDEVIDDNFIDILNVIKDSINGGNKDINYKTMYNIINSDYEGFFYKKTIYKVKKDEKN